MLKKNSFTPNVHKVNTDLLVKKKISAKKRKAVIFVLPYFVGKVDALGAKTRSYLAFPYGPLTIATYVNKTSITKSEVIIEDLNLVPDIDDIRSRIDQALKIEKPEVVGFSFMFDTSFSYLRDLSTYIKSAYPNVIQVVGGAAATTASTEILNELASIDAVCYSEGEKAVKDLLDSEDISKELVKAPWVIRENINKKPESVYVDHLDEVIDLNYEFVNVEKYSMRESFSPFATYRYESNVKQFFLVTSRGCPFKCTFCAEPALHGANMRFATVDSIIDHVRKLKEKYGINVLTLYDDQLLIDVPRAKELFSRLAEFKLRIEMPNGVTAVFIDDELAILMKSAGVDTIALAIESGSEYVLKNIINKPLRIPKLRKVMKSLRLADIFVQGFFVIGMPGETDEHRKETLNLIKDIDLDWASFSVAGPVRGSQLYEEAKEKGWLPKEYSVGNFVSNSAILNIPGYDNQKIMDCAVEFNLISNFVNSRALRNNDLETAKRLFMEVSERAEKHAFAHFYLAHVENLLGNKIEYLKNLNIANEIFSSDEKWMRFANKYDIFSKFDSYTEAT